MLSADSSLLTPTYAVTWPVQPSHHNRVAASISAAHFSRPSWIRPLDRTRSRQIPSSQGLFQRDQGTARMSPGLRASHTRPRGAFRDDAEQAARPPEVTRARSRPGSPCVRVLGRLSRVIRGCPARAQGPHRVRSASGHRRVTSGSVGSGCAGSGRGRTAAATRRRLGDGDHSDDRRRRQRRPGGRRARRRRRPAAIGGAPRRTVPTGVLRTPVHSRPGVRGSRPAATACHAHR